MYNWLKFLTMKTKLIYIGFIIFFANYSCKKEAVLEPTEYPFVITYYPVINEEGAAFSADLVNLGNQNIIKYGFVWSENNNPTTLDNKMLFENDAKKGIYTYTLNSGLAKGQTYNIRSYILTEQYEVYGNIKSFISLGSLPPEIINFDPKYGPIGTQVAIDGKNFALSKSGNIVKFGNTEAIVDSVTENKLFVTIPEINKPEKVKIAVLTAKMEVFSSDSFDLWFPWLQKNEFSLVGNNSASFSIGNIGYVINSNSSVMLSYYPESDTWMNNKLLPENSGYMPLAYTYNDKAYALFNNNLWEYDPSTNNWVKKANFPGTIQNDKRYVFGMSINDKIYIGNCYNNYEFWQYNINQDSWQRKADFIGNFEWNNPVGGNYSFTTNNRGYLGISRIAFGNHSLWEYNPLEDSWSNRTPLPSNALTEYCCFVINNEAYVGLGESGEWMDNYACSTIWKYNNENDNWISYKDCPIKIAAYSSFSLNNKGYIVSGFTEYHDPIDNVWEFDPLKN